MASGKEEAKRERAAQVEAWNEINRFADRLTRDAEGLKKRAINGAKSGYEPKPGEKH